MNAPERPEQDPVQRRLQSLFTHWCKNPTNPDHRAALKSAMQSHELGSFIKQAIPALELSDLPPSPPLLHGMPKETRPWLLSRSTALLTPSANPASPSKDGSLIPA